MTIWIKTVKVCEKDEFTVKDIIAGGSTISDLESRIFLGNTDKTYTCMLGSTQSYSGNSYETNTIKNLKGGNTYVLSNRVTIDGEVKTRKCEIRVHKESDLF